MNVALRYAARSDVGLVRSNNQDSAYAGPHLLAVADGMGGHAGGDVASSVAIAALAPLDEESHGPDDALRELAEALDQARAEIIARSRAQPDLAGMGTTVTAILRAGNALAMVHLGDSRGYLLRDGELSQVTVDHTFVQHLVDTGRITAQEAEHHPQRSVIMRVLGDFDVDLAPDLSVREARPGDRWLLCSDGLSGFVSAETLATTLRSIADLDACADRLIQLALRAGGGDNITVVLADVVDLDALGDGEAPGTTSIVVGSAALDRHAPSSAADGPAARAAAIGAAAAPADEEEDEPTPRRHGLALLWVGVLVLVLALAGGGYAWTRTQYYLGDDDGRVAISRGLPATLGPLTLSEVVETSDIAVDDLKPYLREQVRATIHVASLEAGRALVADLADGAVHAAPTPSPAPTRTATGSPSPTPTLQVTPPVGVTVPPVGQ